MLHKISVLVQPHIKSLSPVCLANPAYRSYQLSQILTLRCKNIYNVRKIHRNEDLIKYFYSPIKTKSASPEVPKTTKKCRANDFLSPNYTTVRNLLHHQEYRDNCIPSIYSLCQERRHQSENNFTVAGDIKYH